MRLSRSRHFIISQQLLLLVLPLILLPASWASFPHAGSQVNFGFGVNAGHLSSLPKEMQLKLRFESKQKSDENSTPVLQGLAGPNSIVPVTYTDLGGLFGKLDVSRQGRWYYAFLGVPYAEPVQRFKPSTPVKPWGNIRDARNSGPMCMQPGGTSGVQGEENCLFLDVYHPHEDLCLNASESGKLPVIVNIHGGGFTGGTGSWYTPKYFLDECVVYVTINYRLGVFGYLTTKDSVLPGNLGMKDQVLALKWVQNYIADFRGDKNLVTVVGISAGGSSVSHLVTSPMAAGLIHRGIAMSGNVLNPWSVQENPDQVAVALAANLKCPTDNTTSLRKCLEEKSASDIMAKQSSVGGLIPYAPVVESANAVNPFLSQNPAVRYRNGDFNRVPLMCGFVEDEGIILQAAPILASPEITALLNQQWNTFAPMLFMYDTLGFSQEKKDDISKKIRQFYFGTAPISQANRQNLTDLYSDRLFAQGAMETVEMHSKYAPAFPYVMSYKGGVSGAWGQGYLIPAITHGDDGQYLFQTQVFGYGTDQYDFSRKIIKYWTSFAKTGKPEQEPSATPWKSSVGRSNQQWFQLNAPNRNLANYLEPRRQFWQSVGIYETELY